MCLGELGLGRTANRADDCRAELFQPLAGDQADTAGGGVKQNGFAFPHFVGPSNQIFCGHALKHHRGCLLVRNPGWKLDYSVGGHNPHLRVGAWGRGVGDTVANAEAFYIAAYRLDGSGRFHADTMWHGQGIEAATMVDVDVIEADMGLIDQDFATFGFASWISTHFMTFGLPCF